MFDKLSFFWFASFVNNEFFSCRGLGSADKYVRPTANILLQFSRSAETFIKSELCHEKCIEHSISFYYILGNQLKALLYLYFFIVWFAPVDLEPKILLYIYIYTFNIAF